MDSIESIPLVDTAENLVICHVNIRRMNSNFPELAAFIDRLASKPDVIVCSETGNLDNPKFYELKGYEIAYNASRINIADGVLMYIGNKLVYSDPTVDIIENFSFLSVNIKVRGHLNFRLSSIYRCHDVPKEVFLRVLEDFLVINGKYENHCVIGDCNINTLSEDNTCNEYLQSFLSRGYLPLINSITRPNFNDNRVSEGSCIDHIFLKTKLNNITSYTINNLFTDHYPIFAVIGTRKPISTSAACTYINHKHLQKLATQHNWSGVLQTPEPEMATTLFINDMQDLIKSSTFRTRRKDDQTRKPFITQAILISIRKKEKLYNLYKLDKSNGILRDSYFQYLKVLAKVIKKARIDYETNIISSLGNSTKKIWNYVNGKIKDNVKKRQPVGHILDDDGNAITDTFLIANKFNDFYAGVGENLAKKIVKPKGLVPMPQTNANSLFFEPITRDEIEKTIKNMTIKAGGCDGIGMRVLKTLCSQVSGPLEHVFGACVDAGVWPSQLKVAEIVPINKKGSRNKCTNYRPISLISNVAKIFERLVHNRLLDFFLKMGVLSDKQCGFVRGRSTNDALTYITNYIYKSINKGDKVLAVFLDFAKAFDTVNHDILLRKLYCYGIRGIVLELLKSYLSGRKQSVRVDGVESNRNEVRCGVPQGSILGPLLFVIYINDMLTFPCISYADDTVIYFSAKTWEEAEKGVNNILSNLTDWLALNQLSLNVEKTVVMTFGSYADSVPNSINVCMNGSRLARVNEYKYLGVWFDTHMRWDIHIKYIVKSMNYLLFVFYKLRLVLKKCHLKMLYYALFHSCLNYGSIVWGSAHKTIQLKLNSLQKRMLRLCDNLIAPRANELFVMSSLVYYYQFLSTKYTNAPKNTRFNSIELPLIHKEIYKKSSEYISIISFNKLPNEMKVLDLRNKSAKKQFKRWLCKNISDFVDHNRFN